MEKTFGVKDFFILMVMLALIVLVIVAMRQFDRQYDHVQTIKQQNDQLAAEVSRIRRQVSEISAGAVTIQPGTQTQVSDAPVAGVRATVGAQAANTDAFTHIRAAEKAPGFARGGWFIDNFGTKVGRLTPFISTDVYQSWVENQVMESLVVRDPYSLEFVPRLARRWEISEDGLTMTFYLREEVTFSDGHPLTADDVVFTFDWIMNPEVNAPRTRAYMTQFDEVRKLGDYVVQFTFKEPYFKNFETVAYSVNIMPKHFYSKFTPNQFNERMGLLMGSGPYMLENPETWTPGNGVVLLRNPRYWSVEPTFDRIVFNEIQEESAEMVRYGNQQHDLIRCTPEVYERLVNDSRIMGFSNNYRYTTPYAGYSYIGWNQKRKVGGRETGTPFADKRVRQAMTMLIDRERMAREIFLGYATVASGPFAPKGPQADPDVQPWPYDESRARQLLKEAGFEDRNGDGVVEGPDGRPFRFTLTYPGGQEIYEKMILFLRDNLARGGIIMEPERLDWPVLIGKLNNSDFDAVILGWSSTIESDAYQVFHSDQIKDQGDNRTGYSNPEIDKVIHQARGTMDTEQRMQYWHQVHRILHEDQPYTFLFNRDALRLFNKRIHNIEPSQVGLNFEYLNGGMIPWFIPSQHQKMVQ